MDASPSLTLRGDIFPLLEAFAGSQGYGDIVLTFEKGAVRQVEVQQRMRAKDQLRGFIKALTGL